jgi:large subunit ribosomal protein L15
MLNNATTTIVDADSLIKDRIISKANDGIVILATGKLEKKLTVKAKRFTANAKKQIEALGGKTEVI